MPQDSYKVNLLPPGLQREGIVDVHRLVRLIALTLSLAFLLGGYGYFLFSFWGAKNELAAVRQELTALRPVLSRVEDVREKRIAAEAAYQEYSTLLDRHQNWAGLLSDLFHDLNNIAPVDLWLLELEIYPDPEASGEESEKKEGRGKPDQFARANSISIKGSSRTVSSVGVFIKNLNRLPYLQNVALKKIAALDDAFNFEITAGLKER
ncbi:type IV pilus assembly protein PilN [Thermacetogenium phaeum DSM 12270]|uniref:Type IV pilus assembly protein PilN n=1 Tax=Thermacetogenium phaeum (strain ATCC BAA-254 / DSM 26808 / PB) TaxID=1089553 RepID=K4LFT3_THEPS|nr:PilN domain-containing protein [Thermacetogenium phaeum]AFV11861.1 type IV pilus assembly protein PilN [Thermacetogenium phaeum DSM 12270]